MNQLVQPAHLTGRWLETGRWRGLAAAQDGKLYAAPFDGGYLLAIDPTRYSVDYVALPDWVARGRFEGIVAAQNGKLYLSPVFAADLFSDQPLMEPPAEPSRLAETFAYDILDEARQMALHDPFCLVMLAFDVDRQEFSCYIYHDEEPDLTYNKWSCAAMAQNGKLYYPPDWGSVVLVLDPAAGKVSSIHGADCGHQLVTGMSIQWTGITCAPDGLLYCSPGDARSVLVIDPTRDHLHHIWCDWQIDHLATWAWASPSRDDLPWGNIASSTLLWGGIACGGNGQLYCAPRRAPAVLVIDCKSWHARLLSLPPDRFVSCEDNWAGIVAAADGRLYCCPSSSDQLLVIDPVYDTLAFIDIFYPDGFHCAWAPRWHHSIIATSDRIWCAPDAADTVLTMLVPPSTCTSLMRSKQHFDVAIETDSGYRVECHRAVLSSTSKVFQRMLESGFREAQDHVITMKQVSTSTANALLDHVYCGRLADGADLFELASVARMYEYDYLLAQCLQVLSLAGGMDDLGKIARTLKLHAEATPEAWTIWHNFKHGCLRDARKFHHVIEALADERAPEG